MSVCRALPVSTTSQHYGRFLGGFVALSVFVRFPRLQRQLGLAVTFAALSMPGGAQTVRGSVVSSAMPAGVPGAVVLLLDTTGAPHARALTDAAGSFTLHAPFAGTFVVRSRRIGVRPATVGPFTIAADTSIALRMVDVALDLPPITTNERARCQLHPDSALALAALWEDAKTALLAAAITRERAKYRFDVVDHSRVYDFSSRQLQTMALLEGQIYNTRSWTSLPPERLQADGYVVSRHDSTTYLAPDIETLLSRYFVDTHCFRFAASSADADSLVAVEFEPAAKVDHAEIRGNLWVDRRSHELRAIDFHYSNIDLAGADSLLGGRVQFAPLATGAWVLTDWWIRIPQMRVATDRKLIPTSAPAPAPRGRVPSLVVPVTSHHLVPDRLHVSGGTLRQVWLDSTLLWARDLHSVQVRVVMPTPGAAVAYLVGSARQAVTDSSGLARLDRLVPGSYLVDIGTPELDILGWARARLLVDLDTAKVRVVTVNLESPLVAARAVCLDDAKLLSETTGVLIGTVQRANAPVGGADVTVTWERSPGVSMNRRVRSMHGDGRFFLCGVPRDTPIEVRASNADPMQVRIPRDRVVGTTLLTLP